MRKVLLVAPTINEADVGEAWVAYQWAAGLAKRHELTVLTYAKRDAPRVAPQLPGARVIEWQEPPFLGKAERLNSLMKPAYLPFYVRASKWIRAARGLGECFDIGHQVAPVAMRYPTPLLGQGIPYLIGPVGGSLHSPPAFVREEGTAPLYTRLRKLDAWRLRRDPLLRKSYEEAECVLGIAEYVQDALADVKTKRVEIMGETGVRHLPLLPSRPDAAEDGLVRLLYVGRLVRTKGARDAIRALGYLRDTNVVLDVVGDGPDRGECQALASRTAVAHRVHFHGHLSRDEVEQMYQRADVFVFPSYREPGGNVQFEAMAHGLPLIVSNRGGPASAVDETCAITVEPTSPEQYATDLAAAISRLVHSPQMRASLGRGARARVEAIGLWDAKVERVSALYEELLQT